MRPLTTEWVAKAEDDFGTSSREIAASPKPNFDATCFHAQQCAEKYLKARLIEAGIAFPKTHDLEELLKILLPIKPEWRGLLPDVQNLVGLAVEVRCPGYSATFDEAADALEAVRRVRAAVRRALGLGA